jgi:NADH-quinone oxidoreductase subunit M
MLLAGVLLKMGGYGFLRILLPNLGLHYAGYYGFLFLLGLVSMIYGGIMALTQDDFKRVIAYSSIAHMGVVVMGLSSANELGIAGSLFQMIAHGLITGLLFLLVGLFYHRTHTRDVEKLGGILNQAPLLSWALLLGCFASLGLPGMASFVGEFTVLIGSFKTFGWIIIWAAVGIFLNMLVFLRLVGRVVQGPVEKEEREFKDLSWEEALAVYFLLLMGMVIGVLPSIVFKVSGFLSGKA